MIVKDLYKKTRKRRRVLKDYYLKIEEVLSDKRVISLEEEADFLERVKNCNKDLKKKKFIVLVAGKLSHSPHVYQGL